jgi:hypothetical protein
MSKLLTTLFAVVVLAGLAGCSKPNDNSSNPKPEAPAAGRHSHPGHDHTHRATDGKYEAELAKLSSEDHQLADKQKTCPVSGEPLGSMGKPYKVTIQDRTVFLCCPGCESDLKKNPEKYLARLPK